MFYLCEVQTGEMEEKRYADFRTYRAEKTYAVSSGKWYAIQKTNSITRLV